MIDGPAGIRQAQQPAHLVERLARGVVHRLAQQPVVELARLLHEERVPAAHHERHQGQLRRRSLGLVRVEQPRGADVALEVVDRDERQAGVPGQRPRHGDAHEQRSGEARALGDGDPVEVAQVRHARRGARLLEHGHHPAQVGARRDLGHDAAGARVERDLARDHVGPDAPAVAR